MTNTFEDHFSGISTGYALYRPHYPDALFDWLASIAPKRDLAWDCATGTGQAAVQLAQRFERVVASDAAAAQIASAQRVVGVEYAVCAAEDPRVLRDGSVDLVTVAQALHWFEHDRFFAEVRRVLSPGGVFAAWTYQLFHVEPRIDAIIEAWYRGPLDAYWPSARRHVEAGYRTIPFPFDSIATPDIQMAASWRLADVLGYLRTWSATSRYKEARGVDPVSLIESQLAQAWGDPEQARRVVWEMPLLVGR